MAVIMNNQQGDFSPKTMSFILCSEYHKTKGYDASRKTTWPISTTKQHISQIVVL